MSFLDALEYIWRAKSAQQLLVINEEASKRLNNLLGSDSDSNPMGRYAEWLASKAYGGEINKNQSQKGFDLTGKNGERIQVKGRIQRDKNRNSRAIRIKEEALEHFDLLVIILFDNQFNILKALEIKQKDINEPETNEESIFRISFSADDNKQSDPRIKDVTEKFQKYA